MIEHEETPEEKNQRKKDNFKSGEKWNGRLKKTLTNDEIICQSLMFLVAGYDTTAATLEFISYNLATHPRVQEILIEEIDRVLEKHVYQFYYKP